MDAKFLSIIVNYFLILSLSGFLLLSFLFFKIKFAPKFWKINLRRITENHSDLSVFYSSIFFMVCFIVSLFYREKLEKLALKEKQEKNLDPPKTKAIKRIFKQRDFLLEKQYHQVPNEGEERKNLLCSLDDNDNY